jgi:hypothetical protein
MGDYAFARNKQLTDVTLGADCVFDWSVFLEEDEVRWNPTTNIGKRGINLHYDYFCNDRKAGTYTVDLQYRAPRESEEFKYVETRYGAAITEYTGSATAVRIPERVNDLTVKYIGNQINQAPKAISYNIERLLIPNTVTAIGDKAFTGNKLTSVVIPDSVTHIGDSALASGTLTSVTIGSSVRTIGDSTFYNNKLTSVTIGSGVSLGSWAVPCYDYYNRNGKNAGVYTQETYTYR